MCEKCIQRRQIDYESPGPYLLGTSSCRNLEIQQSWSPVLPLTAYSSLLAEEQEPWTLSHIKGTLTKFQSEMEGGKNAWGSQTTVSRWSMLHTAFGHSCQYYIRTSFHLWMSRKRHHLYSTFFKDNGDHYGLCGVVVASLLTGGHSWETTGDFPAPERVK